MLTQYEIQPDIVLKQMCARTFWESVGPQFKNVFQDRIEASHVPSPRPLPGAEELFFVLYKNDALIGWHCGSAIDSETYYMKNSAILPAERGQNLYFLVLSVLVSILKDKGYQIVTSLHHPNNQAILIPKLRFGFVISGMQLHERFRFLVEMKYHIDADRRNNYNQLIGLSR